MILQIEYVCVKILKMILKLFPFLTVFFMGRDMANISDVQSIFGIHCPKNNLHTSPIPTPAHSSTSLVGTPILTKNTTFWPRQIIRLFLSVSKGNFYLHRYPRHTRSKWNFLRWIQYVSNSYNSCSSTISPSLSCWFYFNFTHKWKIMQNPLFSKEKHWFYKFQNFFRLWHNFCMYRIVLFLKGWNKSLTQRTV